MPIVLRGAEHFEVQPELPRDRVHRGRHHSGSDREPACPHLEVQARQQSEQSLMATVLPRWHDEHAAHVDHVPRGLDDDPAGLLCRQRARRKDDPSGRHWHVVDPADHLHGMVVVGVALETVGELGAVDPPEGDDGLVPQPERDVLLGIAQRDGEAEGGGGAQPSDESVDGGLSLLGGHRSRVASASVDFEALVRNAIVKVCALAPESVTCDTDLEVLGVDSMAVAEIIVELETELDCEFPVHVLRSLDGVHTVGDVASQLSLVVAAADSEP